MTKQDIETVLERVRTWPQSRQEDAVARLLALEAQDLGVYQLSDDERADLDEALEELARGEVASEEQVAAVFNRYRR